MARKPRVHFAGAFYHVIARGNKGAKVFKTAQDYKLYLRFLKEYKKRYTFLLSAYIHLNPVRAGLGEDPLDYPWSSYKAYASGAVDDLLDQRALLAHFSKIPFRARKEFVRFV